jgi:hypothetical protein
MTWFPLNCFKILFKSHHVRYCHSIILCILLHYVPQWLLCLFIAETYIFLIQDTNSGNWTYQPVKINSNWTCFRLRVTCQYVSLLLQRHFCHITFLCFAICIPKWPQCSLFLTQLSYLTYTYIFSPKWQCWTVHGVMYLFHICALNGYLSSHNKTNKCTYVKWIYHILFITDMIQLPSQPSPLLTYKITRSAEDSRDDSWNMSVVNTMW